MNYLNAARDVSVQANRSASSKEAQSDFTARPFVCQGEFMIELATGTSGEVTREVLFPVTFLEKPLFYWGGVLEDNQSVDVGSVPTISGIVINWNTEQKGTEGVLYKGARLGVVVNGDEGMKFWFNWHFVGIALVNPLVSTTSTRSAI